MRLGLLAVCFAGLYWAGAGLWVAFLVATFLAWGLSYVLLAGPRDAAALEIAERTQARATRSGRSQRELDDDAAEDAAVDAALAATGPGVPGVPVTAPPVTAAAASLDAGTAQDAVDAGATAPALAGAATSPSVRTVLTKAGTGAPASERETDAQQDPVAELEQAGAGEDRDERDAARPEDHAEREHPRG
jgi:hypothetical protein